MSQRRVLLNDVDAAGVVFYARIMAMAHEAYEEAMARAGLALDELIRAGRIGLPLVHAEADFSRPLTHGELVETRVALERVGEKSVTVTIAFAVGGQPAALVKQVHACVDMDRRASVAVPPEMRAKLALLGMAEAGDA
jgi:1,4-dihydroxy-2-naphthoyl-CoA hydrolase